MISFEEVSRNGRRRYLKVKLAVVVAPHGPKRGGSDTKRLHVTIGRTERSREGIFRYLEPESHELNPVLVDRSPTTLKKRIRAHRKGWR